MKMPHYILLFIVLFTWSCKESHESRPEVVHEAGWVYDTEYHRYLNDAVASEESLHIEIAEILEERKIIEETDSISQKLKDNIATREAKREHLLKMEQLKEEQEKQIQSIKTLENQNKMIDSLLKKKNK